MSGCYQSGQTWWRHTPLCRIQRCWCFYQSSWWLHIDPTDQVEPASTHTQKKEVHSQHTAYTKRGRGVWSVERYPEKASIFTHWTLVELFLFATADVKNPAARGERHFVGFLLLISLILINTRTHTHTHTWCSGPDSPQQRTCRWGLQPCRTAWSSSPCGVTAGTWSLCRSVLH